MNRAERVILSTAEQQRPSEELYQSIKVALVKAGGSIPFSQFMQLALYAPDLGYYNTASEKWGGRGDFVTAPELSPLFSRCLARQCRAIFQSLLANGRAQQPLTIMELGGGSGRMAADILTELAQLGQLPAQYLMVDVSPELRIRQQRYLQQHCPQGFERVQWLEKLPDLPFAGVVIANEVIDALAVERLTLRQGELLQGYVALGDTGKFIWQFAAPEPLLLAAVEQRLPLDDAGWCQQRENHFFEFLPQLESWMAELSGCLSSGAMLFIDYGYPRHEYYHLERSQGTLACYYQHICHDDPLILYGLQDITAHVDFTWLAESGYQAGLTVAGFTHQAAFLFNCGLADMVGDVVDPQVKKALHKLLLPGEMGEACKVMALTRDMDRDALQGFSSHDRSHQL